jgi:hypothetical protein
MSVRRRAVSCRIGLAIALIAVVAAVAVPTAAATQPDRVPVIAPDSFTLSGVCGFDVTFDVVVNNETTTTFSDGRTVTTGTWKDVVDNAGDPSKSYADNNSGVIFTTPNADGTLTVTVVGQGGVFFFPGDLGPGSPGMMLVINGRLTETIDANGVVPGSVSYHGSPAIDLCQTLA